MWARSVHVAVEHEEVSMWAVCGLYVCTGNCLSVTMCDMSLPSSSLSSLGKTGLRTSPRNGRGD